jgi:P27 family predicted phage terminase small subunit
MTAPVPFKLKLLRGNPGRRPIKSEPQPRSAAKFPEAPAHLSEYGRREWERIGPEIWALGLLTVLDETSFAAYCSAYGMWRTAEELLAREGLTVRGDRHAVANPLQKIAAQAARDVLRLGSEFGLSPAARVRVAAGKLPASQSKFGDLLA